MGKRPQNVLTHATDSNPWHLAEASITRRGKAPLSIFPGDVLWPHTQTRHRISQRRLGGFRCPTQAIQALNPLCDFLPPFHPYHSTPQISTSKIYINFIWSQSGQRSHVTSKTRIGLEYAIATEYDGIWLYTFDSSDTAGSDVDAGLQYQCLGYGKFIFISILGSLSRALYLN